MSSHNDNYEVFSLIKTIDTINEKKEHIEKFIIKLAIKTRLSYQVTAFQ